MSVRRSLAWTYGAQVISFVISFGSAIIIARLMSPRDFGIFAMAGAATTIINLLMQLGLGRYIMRAERIDTPFLQSVFTVNVIMSLAYSAAVLVAGFASESFFESREVGKFMMVFALFPLMAMFDFVPATLAARDMHFGYCAAMAVLRAVVMASVTIILALMGYGYMSFAWAQVLSWLATAIGYNVFIWRPEVWKLRFEGIRSILKFGWHMIGISGVNQLSARGSEIILGSLLGLVSLGLYNRANSLPVQLYGGVFGSGTSVVFSKMSLEQRETGSFHGIYTKFMRMILSLLWPMVFGLAVLAQPAISILFGAKWLEAAPPMALLSMAFAVLAAIGMVNDIFILKGETSRQLKIEIFRAIIGTSIFAAAALYSLTLAAAAKLIEAIIAFAIYYRPTKELVGAEAGEFRRVYVESALVTVPAVLPSLALMLWNDWSAETPFWLLAIAIGTGVVGWWIALNALRHPTFEEGMRLWRRFKKSPA